MRASTKGTLLGLIKHWAAERPDEPALHAMNASGDWDITTWKTYQDRVMAVARGLMALGVQRGDSVTLVGNNSPEWVICQHGISAAGATPCPIYTTLLPAQVAYIVTHSGSRIVILDTPEQLAKIEASEQTGEVEIDHLVAFGELSSGHPRLMTLSDLEAKGLNETSQEAIESRLDEITPDDSTLRVYTSGTTGVPKGAEITHRGIRASLDGLMDTYGGVLRSKPQRGVSYLPLCHAAEQVLTNFLGLECGSKVYFCPKLENLKDYLVKVHPTYFLGVPRVWEKLQAALQAQLGQATGVKKSLAEWALSTERSAVERQLTTGRPVNGVRRKLARKLVVDKIRAALGMTEVELAVSGAAPLSVDTAAFFQGLGIIIHEGYGMTETTGIATLSPFGAAKLGTVGKPILGVEIKISEEGELLLRGANMIKAYHRLPDKTAELWDGDWMRTGDLAAIDEQGYVSITGRSKDLIITAGGKNVGPVEIEVLLTKIPGIGQAVAIGDRKPYLCALLVIDPENVNGLLQAAGVEESLTAEQAATDRRIDAFLKAQVESECNAHLARYQQIKYFTVLAQALTVESGELTPTMKLKRHVVTKNYADQIERMYGEGGKSRPSAAAESAAPPPA